MFNSTSSNSFKLDESKLNEFSLNENQLSSPDRSSWFNRAYHYLVHHLLRGHEPRVWQQHNTAGNIFYCGYDPYSGRTTYLTSDTDLRTWLDQLPYQ